MTYVLAIVLLSASVLSARAMLRGGARETERARSSKTQSIAPTGPVPGLAESAAGGAKDTPPTPQPKPRAEARAVWVTRWDYRTPADVERIMRQISSANLNIVYFQVRGAGDAYYRSSYEPWAASLSGRLGTDPGWDPLSVAVKSAHEHGLKLHAWINVYPIWYATEPAPPKTKPLSPYYRASWRMAAVQRRGNRTTYPLAGPLDGYIWASPGNPAVQDHVYRVAIDIVKRYDVDGLHMDRVRYPGRQYSWDRASRSAFAKADRAYRKQHPGRRLSRSAWQTGQVTGLVGRIYRGVKSVDRRVQVSAATWGIHTNRWSWSASDGLRDFYQDGQGWMKKGIVDFLAPMTYWKIRQTPPWGVLVKDFVRHRKDALVYPGIAAYKYQSDWREVAYQVKLSRRLGAHGVSFFAYSSLQGHWDDLRRLFPKKADPPTSQP